MRVSTQAGKHETNDCGTTGLKIKIPPDFSQGDQPNCSAQPDGASLCEYLQIVAESYLERYG